MQGPFGTLLGANVNLDYPDGFKNTMYGYICLTVVTIQFRTEVVYRTSLWILKVSEPRLNYYGEGARDPFHYFRDLNYTKSGFK